MLGLTDTRRATGRASAGAVRLLGAAAVVSLGTALAVPSSASAASPHAVLPVSARAAAPRAEGPVGGPLLAATGLVLAPASRTVAAPPNVAEAYLLADLDSGKVLVAKAPHKKLRPASTQKTLTAITLMPRLDPKQLYTPNRQDTSAEGTHVGVVERATYTVDDLFHALLLASGNDSASALANANGGWDKTLAEMAAEAVRLKAFDTTAKNPSGLDAPGQYTSAYDLALIGRQAMRIPQFVATAGAASYDFPGSMPRAGQKRATYKIYTQNRLLLHGYPGAIAGKTGYTTQARRTFWVTAKQGDRTLLVTMLNINVGTEAGARALLNWGFRYADRLNPVGELVEPDQPSAEGATQPAGNPATAPDGTVAAAAGGSVNAPGGSGSTWLWLIVLLGVGGAVLVGLRARTVARERARVAQRARERRTQYYG